MRRILIVCPQFVPVNSADMHRVRQCLPYLRAFGWEAVVLAIDARRCEAPIDPLLQQTVPSDVRVVRTGALAQAFTRRFGLGNVDLRALPFIAAAGSRLLARERFDLVFFSTTAFSLAALGPRWHRRFGVPFVMDLQDPWLSDYYDRPGAPAPPGGSLKYALSRRLAATLEPYTMRHVARVISVSPAYPVDLQRRYGWMRPEQFSVIPFGAAEVDFELLARSRVSQPVFDPRDGYEHWVYVGRAGGDMAFALTALFSALRSAREADPGRFAGLRLHFVGTDYAPGARARKTVEPIAQACGVDDLVSELPHRLPYFQALQCLLDAQALIVPGSDDPGYTASKLFPYILAKRPLLAIFHEQSSVMDVLRRTGAGVAIGFRTGEPVGDVATRIQTAWLGGPVRRVPSTDWGVFEQYTAREMTRRLCAVFDDVLSRRQQTQESTFGSETGSKAMSRRVIER
jgi:hypothetical protein